MLMINEGLSGGRGNEWMLLSAPAAVRDGLVAPGVWGDLFSQDVSVSRRARAK